MAALLQLDRICRAFSGVMALQDVSCAVEAGRVHAIVGENGAGKSTLIKIIAGALEPDRGTMTLSDQPYQPHSPHAAMAAGIATLHQELNLLPARSVVANLTLGQEPARYGVIDRKQARATARRVLEQLAAAYLPLDAPLEQLSLSEKQIVAIAKTLLGECRILIMDEPTAALNSAEVEALFKVMQRLKARGVAVIYVSHRLAEIFQIADVVTVLRDGQHIRTIPLNETTPDELITTMLGRSLQSVFPPRHTPSDEIVLSVEHVSAARAFEDISFQVRAGEVLAITGLAGSGKTQLGRALLGAWPLDQGSIRWFDQAGRITPVQAVAAGVGLVPEDRKAAGLLLDEPVQRNVTLAALARLVTRWGVIDRSGERQLAQRQAAVLHIKAPSLSAPVRVLSGGNQQKTVLARWLAIGARALILLEPTQGIDVGVKVEIYELIAQLAQAGTAIVLVSAEWAEVAGLAQRVLVLRDGRVAVELHGAQVEATAILRAAIGVAPLEPLGGSTPPIG
jgi:ABC-type sugar transport system ATPase subunit